MNAEQKNKLDQAIAQWATLFPVELKDATLACWKGAMWVPQFGLVARVSLYNTTNYRGPAADLVLVRPDSLDEFPAVFARVQQAIERLKTQRGAVKRAFALTMPEILGLPAVEVGPDTFAPSPDDILRRKAALETSFSRFDAVFARMKEVYGLRLPRYIAVWDAFYRSLSPLEAQGLDSLGRSPWGIMVWFQNGGLERKTRDNLDPRLEGRFRCDPPEMVTVMSGDCDGLHFGLWYDDPAELPSFIANNYARDSAEMSIDKLTILRTLAADLKERMDEPTALDQPISISIHALKAALDWFKEADEKALREDGGCPWTHAKRGNILGGLGPALPKSAGEQRATYEEQDVRNTAYGKQSPKVQDWIDQAKEELSDGKPAFALVLGRELHWLDSDAYRKESLELLVGAYEALGRHALAEIAKVHHAHRDLPLVAVFERE